MKHISLLFAGDVMVHGSQLKAAYDTAADRYDFSEYFRSIERHIRDCDLAVCNLETTISGGEPAGYPKFNSPEALADAIAQAGFSCVAAANNHSFDQGVMGVINTRATLEKRGLAVIGTRKNPLEKAYGMFDVNGVRIAILNYTYETARVGSVRTLNNHCMTRKSHTLVNSFGFESLETDMETVAREVTEVRKSGAEVVVVYYHWGNEYERYSNIFQNYVAWRTAQMGVDAIIGSHAHVMQELSEIKVSTEQGEKAVPVFYGLGNYIWGAPPIGGRDTVLNNILARLEIGYDPCTRRVQVEPNYVPMYIDLDPENYRTVDVGGLSDEQAAAFAERYGVTREAVLKEIADTLAGLRPAPVKLRFDRIFTLQTGQRVSLTDTFLPEKQYVRFRCEDAVVASVTQNGAIIGNSAGYVGVAAMDGDGTETLCMVRVERGRKSTFPVLVNANNPVRDIYIPPNRVTGEECGLPEGMSLYEGAAEGWKAMRADAAEQGIYLNPVYGYRTKKDQLVRINKYTRRYGQKAAQRRYMKVGCSEHHLGVVLDVNGGKSGDVVTPKADAIRWVQSNCHKYGFVARKITADMKYTPYVHLRYFDDRGLANYLTENGVTLEDYLTEYELHGQKFSLTANECAEPQQENKAAPAGMSFPRTVLNRLFGGRFRKTGSAPEDMDGI